MKILKIVCVLVLLVSLACPVFAKEEPRTAKVVYLKGTAQVKPQGQRKWVNAKDGMILNEGSILRTRNNSWVLLNVNGMGETAVIEVQENTQLLLSEIVKDTEENTQRTLLDLGIGKILIRAQKLHSQESKFEVKTPTSVVGVRGTTFTVEVEALE